MTTTKEAVVFMFRIVRTVGLVYISILFEILVIYENLRF